MQNQIVTALNNQKTIESSIIKWASLPKQNRACSNFLLQGHYTYSKPKCLQIKYGSTKNIYQLKSPESVSICPPRSVSEISGVKFDFNLINLKQHISFPPQSYRDEGSLLNASPMEFYVERIIHWGTVTQLPNASSLLKSIL